MNSSEYRSLKQAGALLLAIDLQSREGAAFVREFSRTEPAFASTVAVARLLRMRFLVIAKEASGPGCHCVPCPDRQSMLEAVDHAWVLCARLTPAHAPHIGILSLPADLSVSVQTQAALTAARRGVAFVMRPVAGNRNAGF